MLLQNANLTLVMGVGITIVGLTIFVTRWRINRQELPPVKKALKNFQVMTVGFAFILTLLWFALPSTAALSTFGRPEAISSFNDALRYLQEYNDALVRTVEVVHWFLFLFIFWFLTSGFDFYKAISGK
jgi:cytochrome b561